MKCVKCEDLAEYILRGDSLCRFHYDLLVKDVVEDYDWPERIKKEEGYYDKI